MTLTPLLTAPLDTQIHVGFALCALVSGPLALFRRSRDGLHKVMGGLWVFAMAGTAISAFFISTMPMIGPFSVIHLLSVLTLWTLGLALRAALRGEWRRHGLLFRRLYVQAIGIAGLFTLLPGRIMNDVVFPNAPVAGFAVAAAMAALIYAASQTTHGKTLRKALSKSRARP